MSIKERGDTLVEVLIAITIVAFGIGITYATAQHSLDQSITAREHNQALNIIENQITDLRLRYQTDSTNFGNNFGSPKDHFCLNDSATTVSTNQPWTPYPNSSGIDGSSPLSSPTYNSSCSRQKLGDGVTYYIDIKTTSLSSLGISVNPTLYQVFVRWERVGGGPINQASAYYRINGGTAGLGNPAAISPAPAPQTCNPPAPNPFSFQEEDSLNLKLLKSNAITSPYTSGGSRVQTFDIRKYNSNQSLHLLKNCTYNIALYTSEDTDAFPSPDSTNQQLFLEFCTDLTACTTADNYASLTANPPASANVVVRTPLTPDVPRGINQIPTQNLPFTVPADIDINYVLVKHCSLWSPNFPNQQIPEPTGGTAVNNWATCRSNSNVIDHYFVTITASP